MNERSIFCQFEGLYQLGLLSDTQFTGQTYLKNNRELGRAKGISVITSSSSLPLASWDSNCRPSLVGRKVSLIVDKSPGRTLSWAAFDQDFQKIFCGEKEIYCHSPWWFSACSAYLRCVPRDSLLVDLVMANTCHDQMQWQRLVFPGSIWTRDTEHGG